MKLRILGCGTSAGVPRIGNDWGDCDPAEPRNRRTRSALLVTADDDLTLVDCGPDLRQHLLAAEVARLDRVIVTHDHADHCHGIDDLRQVASAMRGRVTMLARQDTLDRLERRFAYAFEGTALYPPVFDTHALGDQLAAGAMNIRFVDQPHGGVTSLGLRFDHGGSSAAYAVDFHDMTEAMAALYTGVDTWICDCLGRTPHPTHAHLDAVLGWAREFSVGQLILTHMDKSMDYRALAAMLPDWAAPGFDGMDIG